MRKCKGAAARRQWTHYVYEAWRNNECLYVGLTESVGQRFGSHASQSEWWKAATHFRIEVVPDREAGLILEAHLIRKYQPRYNWNHTERAIGSRSGVGHGGVAFGRHYEDDDTDAPTS